MSVKPKFRYTSDADVYEHIWTQMDEVDDPLVDEMGAVGLTCLLSVPYGCGKARFERILSEVSRDRNRRGQPIEVWDLTASAFKGEII